jgi:hydroxymethylpyrimidine/phosphomethylpyrimidine kinase
VLLKSSIVNDGKENFVTPPVALTVAGFDPSSGAGVTADLKVFARHGVYGVAAITALTVQSTLGVIRVDSLSGRTLRETLACLAADFAIAGVKIGMLGSAEAAAALAEWLRQARIPRERIVLDPVLRSSSGRDLLEADGVEVMRTELLPVVGWATPNVDELAALVRQPAGGSEAAPQQARELAALSPGLSVVVTGGHLEPPDDLLLTASGEELRFPGERVETTSTHGTGCAFSSALLCRIIAGDSPAEAVRSAKAFVARALERAAPVGRGKGPVVLF